jgi:hypothetical protein
VRSVAWKMVAARTLGTVPSAEDLQSWIRIDGGLDVSHVSKIQMAKAIDGLVQPPLEDLAFAFSSLLAYYAAADTRFTERDLVLWMISATVCGHCARERVPQASWEFNIRIFCTGLSMAYSKMKPVEVLCLFEDVFGCDFAEVK